jgi:DNA repair photolyase
MPLIKKIHCKSILNKSGIPVFTYTINPYIGCSHKCQYCYAVFMKKFTGHTAPWGTFVDVKINAAEVLSRQLKRCKPGRISFSTVCDPYQHIEAKYKITRQCLEKLIDTDHSVSILTKSSLVVRDIDILKQLRSVKVGFTITTFHPRVKRFFEPKAPPARKRFEALKTLSSHGIQTWIFVAPVLPYFTDSEETLNRIFRNAQNNGARYIQFDALNPYPKVWNNISYLTKRYFPEAYDALTFFYYNRPAYLKCLNNKIFKISQRYTISYKVVYSCTPSTL